MKPRITEEDWWKAKDVVSLDLYRSAWKLFRKWRLFGIACCRRAMTLTPDQRLDTLVKSGESFADGSLTWEQMKAARRVLALVRNELGEEGIGPDEVKHDVLNALDGVTAKEPLSALEASQEARFAFAAKARPKYDAALNREEKETVLLARDIFCNPFRPVTLDPAWRTTTAIQLAQGMYDARDFAAMPILADALQDAGCEDADILDHCRGPGPHVRGCWVVDLVLEKS